MCNGRAATDCPQQHQSSRRLSTQPANQHAEGTAEQQAHLGGAQQVAQVLHIAQHSTHILNLRAGARSEPGVA